MYSILIVEDDKEIRNSFRLNLGELGYQVDVAENGQVGLELWQGHIYDLILMDLKMPVKGGMELIKEMKTQRPYTQIVILSGEGEKQDAIEAHHYHVFDYLEKPVKIKTLLPCIESALQERDPILLALENLVREFPEDSLLIGEREFTNQQIYDEVRQGTPWGLQYAKEFRDTLLGKIPQ